MTQASNNTAVITGASSGLGTAFAKELAKRGYNLILVARREERLEVIRNSIETNHGVRVTVQPADLSKLVDIEQLVSVIKSTPDIEILVNNAGFGIYHKFLKTEPEIALALSMVHMTAPIMLCRAVLPDMVSRNKGAIINVSSIAGIIPIRSVLYGPSKSFLINFSKSLHEELRGMNIRIQALCPGFIVTEFHDTIEYSRFTRASIPGFMWQSPEWVASESIRSLSPRKVVYIPGRIYRFIGTLASRDITAGLVTVIARYILKRRKS